MPTARESLLEAARNAVERRPWPVVRMVEVAAAAGVSRQTLYNEFGDKAGLGAALVDRQVHDFLEGFSAGLAESLDDPPGTTWDEALSRAADWMLRAARRDPMVRATLTGCQSSQLPPYAGPIGHPGQLVAELRDRALGVLAQRALGGEAQLGAEGNEDHGELAGRCETAIRLALSHIVAPAPGTPAPGHVPLPRPGTHLNTTTMRARQRAALSRPRGAPE